MASDGTWRDAGQARVWDAGDGDALAGAEGAHGHRELRGIQRGREEDRHRELGRAAKVWDAAHGYALLLTSKDTRSRVDAVSFSADGKRIASTVGTGQRGCGTPERGRSCSGWTGA